MPSGRGGDGAEPVTGRCLAVRGGLVEGVALVDTPGWSDSNRPDRANFASILRFLKDEGLTRLRAVIWNVTPEIRITREMCR